MIGINWASLMPLFGKRRRTVEARAERAAEYEHAARGAREEVARLRAYINGRMEEHFRVYSGGLLEQMKTLSLLALPTPWVPVQVIDRDYPVDIPYSRQTWVQERRMVPLRDAGRV